MHWNGDWHMGWMWIWWLLGIAAVAATLWVVVSAGRRNGGTDESPEQVLRRRYAKGEIDRETYERMLQDLRK